MTALDQLGLPLILFDANGQEIHRTAALAAILIQEVAPLQMQVFTAARQIAHEQSICSDTQAAHNGFKLMADGQPATTIHLAATHCYSVRAVFIPAPESLATAPHQRLLLVALDRRRPVLPSTDQLRTRFALTRREADVALLLAQRMQNAEIARTLCVSAHTARHHTEQVLGKLNVHRRAEVARVVQSIHVAIAGAIPGIALTASNIARSVLDIGFWA
ncbi:response regulator transcription factor [Salinisphaera aquimarina]|uniref:Response regulator transcription factor n=1 Tax=Salinisphaera aquimarina TaxID=2094031 RepID=A0ABV7ES56_9GAMM